MMSGARETMSGQAARQDGALNWWGGTWGATNDVVVAINGGFFNMTTGLIDGGQIQSGWYAHWFNDMGSFSGFAWKTDRTAFHGECIDHTAANVYVKFVSNGSTMGIDGVNRTPGTSDLVVFTPQWDNQTPTGTRTEVVVRMQSPTITTSGTGHTTGTIISKAQNTGSTWIPFDCIVLSAGGSKGTTLAGSASVGDTVYVYQQLVEKNEPDVQGSGACQTNTGVNWANVYASINTNYHFLKDGVVRVPDAVAHPGYIGYVNLNPRTAICWNSTYVFFIVCDGRSSSSIGMSCERLGNWAKATLGATDGVNCDGGGSSEMIVNGTIVNNPSDGSERAVCNGVLMINVVPKQQTTTFSTGQTVTVASAANLRLGPGTNYGLRGTASAGQTGTVLSHSLNGVYAKGYNWWYVSIGGVSAWIGETLLVGGGVCVPPSITSQPGDFNACEGSPASFSVSASGTGPLAYQWQRSTNGGLSYQNVTTGSGGTTAYYTTEATTSAMSGYLYRCVVTGQCSPVAVSNGAALTVGTCTAPVLVNGGFEESSTNGVGNGWTSYTQSTAAFSLQTASPAEGSKYQQVQVTTANNYAGVYQVVTGCTTGAVYTIAGYYRTNSTSATASVRVDTAGGTTRPSTVNQSTTSTAFVPFSFNVTAAGPTMTIFLDALVTTASKACAFDGISISGNGCVTPTAPTSASADPSTICAGSMTTLTAAGGSSDPCKWYAGGCGGTLVGTGTTIVVNPTSTTTYYARRENGCGVTTCVSATVTVSGTAPAATVGGPQLINSGGTTTSLGGNTPIPPATGAWSVVSGGTGTFSSVSDPNATFTHVSGAGPFVLRWTVTSPPCTPAYADVIVRIGHYCLINGNFDSGFDGDIGTGWTKADPPAGEWAMSTSIAHSSPASQRITDVTGAPAYTTWLYQQFNVKPNRVYVPKLWIYRLDSAVARIGVDPDGGTNFTTGDAIPAQNQWTYRVHDAFTSGSTGIASIGLSAGYQTNSGTVYFDDVTVEPQAPQSTGGTSTINAGSTATLTASGGFGGDSSELCWYTGPAGTGAKVGVGTTLVVAPASTTTYYPRWETSGDCGISEDGASVTVTVTTPLPAPTVTSITPAWGSNNGTTSVTDLAGANFQSGASVKLTRSGQSDIAATGVSVVNSTKITCSLGLSGKKTGLWNVVVTNPDLQSGTLANGFGIGLTAGLPLAGTTIRSLLQTAAVAASGSRLFCVWGKVQTIDARTFWLDDGSGIQIKVFAPGYSVATGSYAAAIGAVDVSVTPPVLISASGKIKAY
jgi:exopolysaccharide biosynthesis protein